MRRAPARGAGGGGSQLPMDVLTRVRRAVCAIGYLKVSLEHYKLNPEQRNFEITGSGFLVGSRRVITCAHVITDMNQEMRKKGVPEDRQYALFVYPAPTGKGWRTDLVPYKASLDMDIDIGLLTLETEVEPEGLQVSGLGSSAPQVGEDIGLVSYAHGSELIYGGKSLQRFGPVFQRGYISALAPYEAATFTKILLDLVAAYAASGGPVFRIETGEVIGVLQEGHVGRTATTSMAIPISHEGESVFVEKKRSFGPKLSEGGKS